MEAVMLTNDVRLDVDVDSDFRVSLDAPAKAHAHALARWIKTEQEGEYCYDRDGEPMIEPDQFAYPAIVVTVTKRAPFDACAEAADVAYDKAQEDR
jgi:hypothetical protein